MLMGDQGIAVRSVMPSEPVGEIPGSNRMMVAVYDRRRRRKLASGQECPEMRRSMFTIVRCRGALGRSSADGAGGDSAGVGPGQGRPGGRRA